MIKPLHVGGPEPPPSGPPPPSPSGPCSAQDTFPATVKGAAPVTRHYQFTNNRDRTWVIDRVFLANTIGTGWSLDASDMHGVLEPGDSKAFTVTFTPPAK